MSDLVVDRRTVARLTENRVTRALLRQELLVLSALTIVSAALRLYGITSKSIWYDEAFVVTLAQKSIPDMIQSLIDLDPHPPLYYLLMHFWLGLGSDPLMVRIPSALISTATVPLLYATGVRLIDKRVALGAAMILAVSPFHIAWAQEARMYALLGLLCLGSTYFLVRALQERRRIHWLLHALLSAAALYTQAGAVFYLAAQGIAVLVLLIRQRGPREVILSWVASQAGAILLFFPWLPAFVVQNQTHGGVLYSETSLGGIEGLLLQFSYSAFPYWHAPLGAQLVLRDGLLVVLLIMTGVAVWSLRGRLAGALLLFLFLGTIGLLALAGLWRAVVIPKAVLPASLAYYLLIIAGLAAWRRKVVLIGGIALLLAFNLVGLARYHYSSLEAGGGGSREDWGQVVSLLQQQIQPREVVLVDASSGLIPLRYHLERQHLSLEVYGAPFKPWAAVPPALGDEDFRRLEEILRDRPAVWLIMYRNGFPDPNGQLRPYLASRYVLTESRLLPRIQVYRFVPKEAASLGKPPGKPNDGLSIGQPS